MKKLFVLLTVIAVSASVASAQNYQHGIGLRLGYSPALDFKWNVSEKNSWEFNLAFPSFHGIGASAAYQWNWPLGTQKANGEGFNAYAGPALSAGFMGGAWKGVVLGVGGHGGVEYKFKFPLALGIDYKPAVAFVLGNNGGLYHDGFWDFSLVARYTF